MIREKLRVSMLKEGQFYLQAGRTLVRLIETIDGKNVYWRDHVGPGRCTKETFVKNCIHEATPEEVDELFKKGGLA